MTKLPNFRKKLTFLVILITLLFIFLIGFLIYSSFFYYASCENDECFFSYLENCERVSYVVSNDFDVIYRVEGRSLAGCEVVVSIDDKDNIIGLEELYKGTNMVCNVRAGYVSYPEHDLERCSGMLKEGLQEVLIDRLKVEIARNIGEINIDILKGV